MKRSIAILAALILAIGTLSAEGFQFEFKDAGLWYGDVQFGLPVASIKDLPLTAQLRTRVGYEGLSLLRDPVSGDIVAQDAGGETPYVFDSLNFRWAIGLDQALLVKDGKKLADAFVYYRGRYDILTASSVAAKAIGSSYAATSDFEGLFGNSFLAGVAWDSTARDSRRVKSGLFAELSAEYAPPGFDPVGGTDFIRGTAKASAFLPAFSKGQAQDERLNLVSAYLAAFASVDYATGDAVPIWVMQSFGGRDLRSSLGDCVRGYPGSSYDAELKAVANVEFRLNGPALFKQAWLLPTVYAFVDGGAYSGFANTVADSAVKGVLASTGVGIGLNILDFVEVGIYGAYRLVDDEALYGKNAASGFALSGLQMGFHF